MAWAAPVVTLAGVSPAFAASPVPGLDLVNTVGSSDYNGLGAMNTLGGAERFYANGEPTILSTWNGWANSNDFRYRFRVRNSGPAGTYLNQSITVKFHVPAIVTVAVYNASKSWIKDVKLPTRPFNYVGLYEQMSGVGSTLGSNAGMSWTYAEGTAATQTFSNKDDTYYPVTLTLNFSGGASLASNQWAQIAVDWKANDNYNVGVGENADQLPTGYPNDTNNIPGVMFRPAWNTDGIGPTGYAWTWKTIITANTAQANANPSTDSASATSSTGLWYFNGGPPRNYGDGQQDRLNSDDTWRTDGVGP